LQTDDCTVSDRGARRFGGTQPSVLSTSKATEMQSLSYALRPVTEATDIVAGRGATRARRTGDFPRLVAPRGRARIEAAAGPFAPHSRAMRPAAP
jgi:hypothetical protein